MSFLWHHPEHGPRVVPEQFRSAFRYPTGRALVPVQPAQTGFFGYRYQVWKLVRFTDNGEWSYVFAPSHGPQNEIRSRVPLRVDQVRAMADRIFGARPRAFSMYDENERRVPGWTLRPHEVWETGANGWRGSVIV